MTEVTCICGHKDVQHFEDGRCDVLIDYGPDAVGWPRKYKCLCEHFEATAPPMPEPTPDLAAIVERLDRFYREAVTDSGYQDFRMMRGAEFKGGIWTYWPAVHVALERTAELERALGEGAELMEFGYHSQRSRDWLDRVKALVARSAAAKEEK